MAASGRKSGWPESSPSPETRTLAIKSYIRGAYRKLGVTRRSQAVVWAVGNGFATAQPVAAQGASQHQILHGTVTAGAPNLLNVGATG